MTEIDLADLARDLTRRFAAVHPVRLAQAESVKVMADRDSLDQALVHLIQNAIDASEKSSPVFVGAKLSGINGQIEIIDAGHGMSPEFVRSGLFKPFISSKQSGFGIGAFEAREMIRAMGGRVMVESREGAGTRFSVILPVAETRHLASTPSVSPEPSNEVA